MTVLREALSRNMEFLLKDCSVIASFWGLELESEDKAIGMQWLRTLESMGRKGKEQVESINIQLYDLLGSVFLVEENDDI